MSETFQDFNKSKNLGKNKLTESTRQSNESKAKISWFFKTSIKTT